MQRSLLGKGYRWSIEGIRKGPPLRQKWYIKGLRVGARGVASPYKTFLSTPTGMVRWRS